MAVALARRGVQVSVLDLAIPQGEETVRLVKEEHARISYKPTSPSAIFIQCDVSKSGTSNHAIYKDSNQMKINFQNTFPVLWMLTSLSLPLPLFGV